MLAIIAIANGRAIVLEEGIGLYFTDDNLQPIGMDVLTDKAEMKTQLLSATSKYGFSPVCFPEFIDRKDITA